LIVGAGPIGLMHLQLSKIVGASKVIVSEPIASRREKALKLGADVVVDSMNENLEEIIKRETDGLGVDVVIMAIGVPAIVNSTIKLCKKGGTVCLFAGFSGTGECTIEVNTIHYNEINVCGSTAYKKEDYIEAAELVKNKKINLDEIATHTFSLDKFYEAYETQKSGEGLKIMIKPE
jgi:L-iditol 2-dehydrogenase